MARRQRALAVEGLGELAAQLRELAAAYQRGVEAFLRVAQRGGHASAR